MGISKRGWKGRSAFSKGTFFPEPPDAPDADLTDLDRCQYAHAMRSPPLTHLTKLKRAIQHAPGNKAPGPDGIPNHVLHKAMDIIATADT
jgi:hypothetical protein